jgi:hypothetical protein
MCVPISFFYSKKPSDHEEAENHYWKIHVDRHSGESSLAFHFTAVVYLDTKDVEFSGGDLVFEPVTNMGLNMGLNMSLNIIL